MIRGEENTANTRLRDRFALGFAGRLFVAAVLAVGVANQVGGVYLGTSLSRWLRHRIEADSHSHAREIAEILRLTPHADQGAVQLIAKRMSSAIHARVTMIDPRGKVIADSEVRSEELPNLPNHGDYPEISAAKDIGMGIARRHRSTVGDNLIYVAYRYRDDGHVVRVAASLTREDRHVSSLRWALVLIGLAATGLAGLFAAVGYRALARTLRGLVDDARASLMHPSGLKEVETTKIDESAAHPDRLAHELERNVKQLAAERATMAAVLEGMSESVVALDAEDRITLANHAASKLLGLKRNPLGERLGEISSIPGLADLVSDARSEQVTRELKVQHFEGGMRWLFARAAPLHDDGRVVVLRDMTKVRKLEGMRRNFIANVSHELRTPVSIIRANAETLVGGALAEPKAALRFAEAVLRHSERLTRLIADLLDISRVEAGRYDFDPEFLSVREIAYRAVDLIQEAAERKRISVIMDVDPAIRVHADIGAADQILFNLLENAIKYTPAEGKVRIHARRRGLMSEIEVIDNGPGVPPKHRPRLFQRFYRVDRGRSRNMGGTGLGLTIAKHFAKAQGGNVGMRPREPNGSSFWFSLPSQPVGALPDQAQVDDI